MSGPDSTVDLLPIREHQRFLDTAIHHLRTPLRGIGTSAALLSEGWDERFDEQAKALLKEILDGVTRIDNLTKALANYSMALLPEGPASGPMPVENALHSALATMQGQIKETGATIRYSALPSLRGTHEQLSVLFRCLLSNALEHRGTAPPRIEITAARDGDRWRFAICDNGIGIPAEYQEKIFQPFQRLHGGRQGGAGLGLAICRKIVEAHGGKIWVEANTQVGSTFVFTLAADAS